MSDENEEACLVNPKSSSSIGLAAGTMPYTDGIQSGSSSLSLQHQNDNMGRGSQQSQESETGELIDYNDEVILSQFHADAIKQVHKLFDFSIQKVSKFPNRS